MNPVAALWPHGRRRALAMRGRWACNVAALAGALLAAACGGGGGGGSSEPPTAPPASNALTLLLRLDTETASGGLGTATIGPTVMAMGTQPLMLAQLGLDLAHRMVAPRTAAPVTGNCAGGGTFTLTLTDRDSSGNATAGDSVTAVFSRCGLPALQRAATGELRVDIETAPTPSLATAVRARMVIVRPLLLEGVYGFRTSLAMPEGTLSGTMALEWQGSATESTLRAVSSTADDLQMNQGTVPWRWTRLRVERKVRHDIPGVASTMALDLERAAASARVVTDEAVGGALNTDPVAGTVRLLAGGGRELRVKFSPRTTSFANGTFEIIESSGRVLQTTSTTWDDDNGALVWDGRDLLQYTHPIRQVPAAFRLEGPRNMRFLPIDRLFAPPASAEPVVIDPLFVHPVLPAAGVTSADAVFRLQLTADIQEGQPVPRFRFNGAGSPNPLALPRPSIEARLTRRGALWLLQPTETLGHGTSYELETSLDGVDWDSESPRPLRLLDGSTLQLPRRLGLGTITTPATLRLTVPTDQVILLGQGDTLSLTATVQTALGQGIASLRWQQVSGEPLVLETPETATTRVRPAATASGLVGPAQLMLTAVDSLGNVERLRLNLTVGNRVASGALLYAAWQLDASVQGFFAPRSISTGLGRVDVVEGRPGTLQLNAGPADPFTSSLRLAPPAGASLAVGSYEGASFDFAATGVPYLSCLLGTCNAQTRSRFQVLQLERDAQGRITRLAVDYEQTSPSSIRPKVTGGYRFNSTLPVGP